MPYIGKKPADIIATAVDTTTGNFSETLAVTGETTLTTHLNMGDNDIIKLGDSADLQIYHNGSASVIKDGGTGDLYIAGSTNVKITNGDINEDMAVFTHNGAVTLNYDNSPKFATTSTGIDVTGTVTADGNLLVGTNTNAVYYNSVSTYNASAVIKTSTSNDVADLVLVNGDNNFGSTIDFARTNTSSNDVRFALIGGYVDSNTAGSESGNIRFSTKDTGDSNIVERMRILSNGDISFYEDTGTTPKLFWDSSAESLGIGTSSPSRPLHVSTTNNVPAEFNHSDGTDVWLKLNNTTQNYYVGYVGTDFVLSPDTATRDVTIDSSGNLLVGHTSQYSPIGDGGSGVTLNANGQIFSGCDFTNLYLNAEDSNNEHIRFRKDGADVGTIGVATTTLGTNPYIAGSGGRGLSFDVDTNAIFPCSSTGARSDGSANLGASTARFNELYLSGGVRLGGTGTANELDDYEEGTWSISYTGTGYGSMANLDGSSNGVYRKVGDIVYFSIRMTATTALAIDPTVDRGVFYGLPFTSGSGSGQVGFVSGFMTTSSGFNQGATFTGAVSQGAQGFQLWCSQEHAATNLTYIVVSGMYHV